MSGTSSPAKPDDRFFGGHAIYALLIGGASFVLAAALTLRVKDEDDVAAA